MNTETFAMLVEILDNEQLSKLRKEGMFTDDFILILETEMFKRCLI